MSGKVSCFLSLRTSIRTNEGYARTGDGDFSTGGQGRQRQVLWEIGGNRIHRFLTAIIAQGPILAFRPPFCWVR